MLAETSRGQYCCPTHVPLQLQDTANETHSSERLRSIHEPKRPMLRWFQAAFNGLEPNLRLEDAVQMIDAICADSIRRPHASHTMPSSGAFETATFLLEHEVTAD